jgi:type I restriction enzyme, R subunit
MGFSEMNSVENPAIGIFRDITYDETVDLFSEVCGPDNPWGRESTSNVVLVKVLHSKLEELNPELKQDAIISAVREITRDRSSVNPVLANQKIYDLLKNGVKVQTQIENREETVIVKVIDWKTPENNHFLLASQMWITSEIYKKRPDLIVFINGIPVVLFELKKFTVPVKNAYDENLQDYKSTIPQLFWYNQFVILSNGRESRIGTYTSPWEYFKEWKKINDEGEKGRVSLETIIKGTCDKTRLLDLIENFTLFFDTDGTSYKIIAQNHQYHGVNNTIEAFKKAQRTKSGRIGVFWHTTGSGKSFSMIFFSKTILRKQPGNYTFLVLTDRINLDDQIYENFEKSGTVTEKNVQAKNADHLKQLLTEDHRFVFSLIHKFREERQKKKKKVKTKLETLQEKIQKSTYPILSERDDIIILCDEAHRTQYGDYAANLRKALPNASFIAFTATPLMANDHLTREIFGDYVSTYTFLQSEEDKSTVPLFYVNRKPEVEIIDTKINEKIAILLKRHGYNEDEVEKLRRRFPKQYNVITNETRLDIISKDIVDHFVNRGFMGKAMVISIDRFTAVKMYNKVNHFWDQKIIELEKKASKQISHEKQVTQKKIDYMNETDMAVVISVKQNEEAEFKEKDLDITPHRTRIVKEKLAVKFKRKDDPFRIVFLCSMWTTGFDAPPVSTIYLDKPLTDHTLMQTVSRANRVFPDKTAGTIVDYVGILNNLNEAFSMYGKDAGGGLKEGDYPVRKDEERIRRLEENLENMREYFVLKNIYPNEILKAKDFTQLQMIEQAIEAILENDESKILYLSILQNVVNSYAGLLPNPKAIKYRRIVSLYTVIAESMASDIPDIDISAIERKVADLIDRSISVKPYQTSKQSKIIDLGKIDLSKIKARANEGKTRTEAEKLRSIFSRKLKKLLRENKFRIDFQERLDKIVEDYNLGNINDEEYLDELIKFLNDLIDEDSRHIREKLSVEELAVYDMLMRPNLKLTKPEEIIVKQMVRELLDDLKVHKLVLDWKKRTRTKADVQLTIEDVLWAELPETKYPKTRKLEKASEIYQHVYESYQGNGQSVYAIQKLPTLFIKLETPSLSLSRLEKSEIEGLSTSVTRVLNKDPGQANLALMEFSLGNIDPELITIGVQIAKEVTKTVAYSMLIDYLKELVKKAIGKITEINFAGRKIQNTENQSNEKFIQKVLTEFEN